MHEYRAGAAACEIIVPANNLCMMGWGVPTNIPRTIAAPVFARALVVETADAVAFAYVCVDLCFISGELRRRVVERLASASHSIHSDVLMLTATHTHSSLGGYSREVFYASSVPGFSEANTTAIVDAVVGSLRSARAEARAARLFVHSGLLPEAADVAYNRSLAAYNRNRDVRPRLDSERAAAVSRRVTVVRVDSRESQRPIAILSWFGLHGTCVHGDHQAIHPDHPGMTVTHIERMAAARGWDGVVAVASQTAAGDVTPNPRWSQSRSRRVGVVDDDFEAARRVGAHVGDFVVELATAAPHVVGAELHGALVSRLDWVDPAHAPVSADFCYGRRDQVTESPKLGIAFAFGTSEGPGPARPLRRLRRGFRVAVQSLPRHLGVGRSWAKLPLWTFGPSRTSKVLGLLRTDAGILQVIPNRFVRYIAHESLAHGVETPWVPRSLPSQLVRFGPLLLCAVPFEPTTMAGERLAQAAREQHPGLTHVIICGYANDYASYMCTPEEYSEQAYEGASTLFGRWTLAAWQTLIREQLVTLLHRNQHPLPEPMLAQASE